MKHTIPFMSLACKRTAISVGMLVVILTAASAIQAAPFGGGTSTATNFVVSSSAAWQIVRSISVPSSTVSRSCQSVASLDVINPDGTTNQLYRFTITLDNLNPAINANGTERTVELKKSGGGGGGGGGDDVHAASVSTNQFFLLAPNVTHTIRLLGRKNSATTLNLTVDDASLSIICF